MPDLVLHTLRAYPVFQPVFAALGRFAAAHADRITCHVTGRATHVAFPRKFVVIRFSCRMARTVWMRSPLG